MKNLNTVILFIFSISSSRYSWDLCLWDITRSGPILHEGFAVRDQTKTINQEHTRATLWSTVLRKPLKLISSHSIFFDLTCSQVTSNQGNPTWSTRACTQHIHETTASNPPSPLARADRNSAPRFHFCYTFRTMLLLTVHWSLTDRIPVTLACGTIGDTISAACCYIRIVDPW